MNKENELLSKILQYIPKESMNSSLKETKAFVLSGAILMCDNIEEDLKEEDFFEKYKDSDSEILDVLKDKEFELDIARNVFESKIRALDSAIIKFWKLLGSHIDVSMAIGFLQVLYTISPPIQKNFKDLCVAAMMMHNNLHCLFKYSTLVNYVRDYKLDNRFEVNYFYKCIDFDDLEEFKQFFTISDVCDASHIPERIIQKNSKVILSYLLRREQVYKLVKNRTVLLFMAFKYNSFRSFSTLLEVKPHLFTNLHDTCFVGCLVKSGSVDWIDVFTKNGYMLESGMKYKENGVSFEPETNSLFTMAFQSYDNALFNSVLNNLNAHRGSNQREFMFSMTEIIKAAYTPSAYPMLVAYHSFFSIPTTYDSIPIIFFASNPLAFGFFASIHKPEVFSQQVDVRQWLKIFLETGLMTLKELSHRHKDICLISKNYSKYARTLNLLHLQYLLGFTENIKYIVKNLFPPNLQDYSKLSREEILFLFTLHILNKEKIQTNEALNAEKELLALEKKEKSGKNKKKNNNNKPKIKPNQKSPSKKENNNEQSTKNNSNNITNDNNNDDLKEESKIINNITIDDDNNESIDNNMDEFTVVASSRQKNKNKSNTTKPSNITTKSNITIKNNTNNNNNGINNNNQKEQQIILNPTQTNNNNIEVFQPPKILQPKIYTIGKFKFSRDQSSLLGRGSNGTLVYKGIWNDKIPVAIKQMHKDFNPDISKEINVLINLTDQACTNIVRYIDQEEDDMFVYLGLTLCEYSLQDLIDSQSNSNNNNNNNNGGLDKLIKDSSVLVNLITDIINGLKFLHDKDIVHNDLNPRNILVKDGRFLIADLGLSKMEVASSYSFSMHTPTGQEGYHPAEVLQHQRKTKSVDIFSLGCIIYTLLSSGKHLFGDKLLRVANILKDSHQIDLSLLNSYPMICDLILSMITKVPEKRPTIDQVLKHPVFWSNGKKILFLDSVHTLFNKDSSFNNSKKNLKYLNTLPDGRSFLIKPWNKSFDPKLLEYLNKNSSKLFYNFEHVKDLLRCIRNIIQHHQEIKDSIHLDWLSTKELTFQYFDSQHPDLIFFLYQKLKLAEFKNTNHLKDYYN